MVGISVGREKSVYIAGHGLNLREPLEIAEGITISPRVVTVSGSFGSSGPQQLQIMATVLAMEAIADFSMIICDPAGGEDLATKAWNSLWNFGLLSLAFETPILSLYSSSIRGSDFQLANRNVFIRPMAVVSAQEAGLVWARENHERFSALLGEARFMTAQRYFSNAQYLPDPDAKIMLFWAGIESLLDVDSELRRRIALHSAILFEGEKAEKIEVFRSVQKAYDIRSRVVHGSIPKKEKLIEASDYASWLLMMLLRRTVELGKLPSGRDLDEAAATSSF